EGLDKAQVEHRLIQFGVEDALQPFQNERAVRDIRWQQGLYLFGHEDPLHSACCWSAACGWQSPRWTPVRLGHDNTTAHNAPMFEVIDRDIDVVQRVFLGVQGDAALRVEFHQFDQLQVIAHQAAGDSNFIDHHVHGGYLDRAPIADDKVGAALAQHLPAELFRTQLADKVNDGVRAAVSEVAHRRHHVRATIQHLMRAKLVRQCPRRLALINGDGARAAQGMQGLQCDVAQASYAYYHTVAARVEVCGRAFGHPIGSDTRVGQGGDGHGDDMLVEFDEC